MVKKIIAISIFFVGVFVFFNLLSDMTSSVQEAEKAKQTKVVEEKKVEKTTKTAKLVQPVTTDPVKLGFTVYKRKCFGCHTYEKGQPNRTGPNLWGIVDKDKAGSENFRYSRQLKLLGGVWTEALLSEFVASPRSMIKDTKMTFNGLKSEQDRINIIAFLKTLKD
jgi:cytochrome c